ncbi:MAG: hypothetical protein QF752_03520 [Planctomycetota bacterium]|jgi:hypothetical protein|nr:hypothetical protein [Planctomycetota bacterium]
MVKRLVFVALVWGFFSGMGCGFQRGGDAPTPVSTRGVEWIGSWELDVPAFVGFMFEVDPRLSQYSEEQRKSIRASLEKTVRGTLSVGKGSMRLLLVTQESKREYRFTWRVTWGDRVNWVLGLTRPGGVEEEGRLRWVGEERVELDFFPEKGGARARMEFVRQIGEK